MAYQPTLVNATNIPGGCEVTVIGVDDAGVYPPIRQTYKFKGINKSQLTLPLVMPLLRKTAAQVIQQTILRTANDQLNTLCANQWEANGVPAALAAYIADVQARLAANNIDATTVANYIVAQWQAYSVNVLNRPAVTITVTAPTGGVDTVTASN